MKDIVDELPKESKSCIFSEYIPMTSRYKCMFRDGPYSRCHLDCGKECPYLKKENPMDKLDEFLEKTGIELLPYQKEILRRTMNGEKLYVIFPRHSGRKYFQRLMYSIPILLSKGENDGH